MAHGPTYGPTLGSTPLEKPTFWHPWTHPSRRRSRRYNWPAGASGQAYPHRILVERLATRPRVDAKREPQLADYSPRPFIGGAQGVGDDRWAQARPLGQDDIEAVSRDREVSSSPRLSGICVGALDALELCG